LSTGDHPQFNGNISNMASNSSKLVTPRTYNFSYDALNRLNTANYTGTTDEMYNEELTYDSNGNILTLNRQGTFEDKVFGKIDSLDYAYSGNQLIKVNDLANDPRAKDAGFKETGMQSPVSETDPGTHEYRYDNNGNLVKDSNKGIGNILYNSLNLPQKIDLPDGSYIEYLYDAAGIKLRQKVYDASKGSFDETNYIGNFVYSGTSTLKFIMTDEGRLVPNGSNYDSEYFINDHLGNTRVVVKDNNGKAEVMQESHYYPFGMQMEGMSYSGLLSGVEANKYLYNGKELQDDLGLDWYDYGARFYDAQLGRWHSKDPLSEEYYSLSPYNYVANSPINAVDPNGMENIWYIYIHQGGKVDEKTAGQIKLKILYALSKTEFKDDVKIKFVDEIMESKFLDETDVSMIIGDKTEINKVAKEKYNFTDLYTDHGTTPKENMYPIGVGTFNKGENKSDIMAWSALHEGIHRLSGNAPGNPGTTEHDLMRNGKYFMNLMNDGEYSNLGNDLKHNKYNSIQSYPNEAFRLTKDRLEYIKSFIGGKTIKDNATLRKNNYLQVLQFINANYPKSLHIDRKKIK
jgi:RHS repeat-associated protein